MKSESVITERGQVTLPKNLRDRLGLKPGTRVTFSPSHRGLVIRRASGSTPAVREVFGVVKDGLRTDEYIRQLRGRVE